LYQKFRQLLPISVISWGHVEERLRVHSTPRIVGVFNASGMWSDRSDIEGGTRRESGRNNVVIHLLSVCWSSVQGVFARRYS